MKTTKRWPLHVRSWVAALVIGLGVPLLAGCAVLAVAAITSVIYFFCAFVEFITLGQGPCHMSRAVETTPPAAQSSQAQVFPANQEGVTINSFPTDGSDIYCKALNLQPHETVAIYVVAHKDAWTAGDELVDVSGGAETATADESGQLFTEIWHNPSLPTSSPLYVDLVVDQNRDGKLG